MIPQTRAVFRFFYSLDGYLVYPEISCNRIRLLELELVLHNRNLHC